eukprot:5778669-Pleurochrysis_carterae.AAC.8
MFASFHYACFLSLSRSFTTADSFRSRALAGRFSAQFLTLSLFPLPELPVLFWLDFFGFWHNSPASELCTFLRHKNVGHILRFHRARYKQRQCHAVVPCLQTSSISAGCPRIVNKGQAAVSFYLHRSFTRRCSGEPHAEHGQSLANLFEASSCSILEAGGRRSAQGGPCDKGSFGQQVRTRRPLPLQSVLACKLPGDL